jgi:alkaline phosphatase
MKKRSICVTVFLTAFALLASMVKADSSNSNHQPFKKAKNIIFFVGDGMGVSTVTASRIYSVGVDGKLTMDKFPFTALSKTYTTDHITPDSAGTMTAMMTGVNTNQGLIGFGPETERDDFQADGDGEPLVTLLEIAKEMGKKVGVVSTTRITHATPAACYAHVNDRDKENDIALQALPTDAGYNQRLKDGIDVLMGGGREFFTPTGVTDEEGDEGSRPDGRDLRKEFQDAGYTYVWNKDQFDSLSRGNLPVLGLFEHSHMEYEFDRPSDLGGEPSLEEMTVKSIDLLQNRKGFFLMVEGGRIDHAHHAGNAFRAVTDTEAFDQAIAAAVKKCNLKNTLIIVTADHSHVFDIAGYPLRPAEDLPYNITSAPAEFDSAIHGKHDGILDVVYDISTSGDVSVMQDQNGVPYTVLAYANGPGYRDGVRIDPRMDSPVSTDPDYLQEGLIPLESETHSGEDVTIYAIGPSSWKVHGTVKNTFIFGLMKDAFGVHKY